MKKAIKPLLMVCALLLCSVIGAGAYAYYSGITETKSNSYKVINGTSGETGADVGAITETDWDALTAKDTDGDGTKDNKELMPGQTFKKDPVLTSNVDYDAVGYLLVEYPMVTGRIGDDNSDKVYSIVTIPQATDLGDSWTIVDTRTSTTAGVDTVVLYRYNKQLTTSAPSTSALFSTLTIQDFKRLTSQTGLEDTIDVTGALVQVNGNATVGTGGALSNTTSADTIAKDLLKYSTTGKTYTVTFDKQSGTGGSDSVKATYGSAMPAITVPTRTNYNFAGYYTEENGVGTKYYNADGTSATNWDLTSATTLYAYWTVNSYTVTLDKQEGTGGSDSVTATYDSDMPEITVPTRTNYTFKGYYSEANGVGTKYYNADGTSATTWDLTSDTTLYAYWTVIEYTVTFDKQEGTGGSDSVVATYGSDMPTITVPTRTGDYYFTGYFTEEDGEGTQYYNYDGTSATTWDLTSDTTLYASWSHPV